MGDAEIVTLLISKMDDLKDDIKSVEVKIDKNTDQLNSFEIKATEVLTVHDCDITALKLKVDIMEKDLKAKDAKSDSSSFLTKILSDSAISTWLFRFLLIVFLTLFGMKKDSIQNVMDLSKTPITHIDTVRIKDK